MPSISQPETHLSNQNTGPVPEANQPGHRPEVDQDKPYDKFASTGNDKESADEPTKSSRSMVITAALGALVLLGVLRFVRRRRHRTEIEQAAHSVTDFVSDTVDTMKDTVGTVKDAVKDWIPTAS